MGKITKNGLSGGPDRMKGEDGADFNRRRHESYRNDWVDQKKRSGGWLPKEEYERQTGKQGRKD